MTKEEEKLRGDTLLNKIKSIDPWYAIGILAVLIFLLFIEYGMPYLKEVFSPANPAARIQLGDVLGTNLSISGLLALIVFLMVIAYWIRRH